MAGEPVDWEQSMMEQAPPAAAHPFAEQHVVAEEPVFEAEPFVAEEPVMAEEGFQPVEPSPFVAEPGAPEEPVLAEEEPWFVADVQERAARPSGPRSPTRGAGGRSGRKPSFSAVRRGNPSAGATRRSAFNVASGMFSESKT